MNAFSKTILLACVYAAGFIILLQTSCKEEEAPVDSEQKAMKDLIIPDNFNFENSKKINIVFQDPLKSGGAARYDVFLHNSEILYDTLTFVNDEGVTVTEIIPSYDETNDLIASKTTETGLFNLVVSIPAYITELYVIKNMQGVFTSSTIQVNGSTAVFKGGYKNSKTVDDILYGVNDSGKLFTIDLSNGQLTTLTTLPLGSGACAIDNLNNKLYYVGKLPPYRLYKYDLVTQSNQIVASLNMKVERFDYNPNDGLLYSCYGERLYTIDPSNGTFLTQKDIEDLAGSEFGDIAISPEKKWYLATYNGVYWLEFKTNKVYAHEVTNGNLPFKATGMTITTNGDMWISTHNANSKLVKMNKSNGTWEYKFSAYNQKIDDLATQTAPSAPVIEDADGDGVEDLYDEYPNDALRAYNTYTPSALSDATLAFEDNWPNQGDYDFNDLVVKYRFKTVMNANDKVVELIGKFTVAHIGGIFENGFGLQLPLTESQISSITGSTITQGLVTLNSKGLESGQNKATIIVFDKAQDNIYLERTITIALQSPLDASTVGTPPFNPFIFINKDRGREVHLINQPPTNKMNPALFNTQDDKSNTSQGKYYQTLNKLPWALNFLETFEFPKEMKPINQGYVKFNIWAESGGSDYVDWYKDKPGYRNEEYLKVETK